MRNQTLADYSARIARAVALIEGTAEGDAPPPLAELAAAAALSPFHFNRVFRLMTGETVGAACQRLRLARSLSALLDTGIPVTQASAGAGYATSQAYGRALRQAVGASASELRGGPVPVARAADLLLKPSSSNAPLSIEVVSLQPFQVLALRRQGPYENLDEGFDELFAQVFAQVEPDSLVGIWGVPLDDQHSVDRTLALFDCALAVAGTPPPMKGVTPLTLGGFQALATNHTGSYDAVHLALDHLYRAALDGQLELAETPPLIHYHNQPDEKPEDELEATLYLPLA